MLNKYSLSQSPRAIPEPGLKLPDKKGLRFLARNVSQSSCIKFVYKRGGRETGGGRGGGVARGTGDKVEYGVEYSDLSFLFGKL
jgi:hypothetical protein